MATADELGLTPEQVEAAEAAYRQEKTAESNRLMSEVEEKRLWKEFRKSQRGDFVSNLGSYVVVNAFLMWIDWNQGGGLSWSLWCVGGWGIGVAIKMFKLLAGVSDESTTEFESWKARRLKRLNREVSES